MGLAIVQIFVRLGVDVVVLESQADILETNLGRDTIEHLMGYLREEGLKVHARAELTWVGTHSEGVEVHVRKGSELEKFVADHLVITTDRRPRSSHMGLEEVGLLCDAQGFIQVNEAQQTHVANIYAAGDVTNRTFQAHHAAHEGTLAAHNAISSSARAGHDPSIPFVIYTDPEVAGVGWDEAQAQALGFDADARTLGLKDVLGARTVLRSRGFIKLIRDRRSDRLIGARIVAPQAAELIMKAVMAVRSGMTSRELAALSHPYMGMCGGIKRAAAAFAQPSFARPT